MTISREEAIANIKRKERQAKTKYDWDRKMKRNRDKLIAKRRAQGL